MITPDADVFHDYEFARNPTKNYFMERNRLVFVASAFSLRTIGVLAPVLLVAEAGLAAVALRQGWWRDKVAGWRWIVQNASWVRAHRRELQRLRLVRTGLSHVTSRRQSTPRWSTCPLWCGGNPLMRAYWAVARRLL